MSNNSFCPICNNPTTLLNKSGMKYEGVSICFDCSKKLINNNITIFNLKNFSLDELKSSIMKNNIKKVAIIANETDSRKKLSSSLLRGTLGNALLGPVGLVDGALSGKNKTSSKTTFLIEYEDGHKETKTVDNNSNEYKELCNYLEI